MVGVFGFVTILNLPVSWEPSPLASFSNQRLYLYVCTPGVEIASIVTSFLVIGVPLLLINWNCCPLPLASPLPVCFSYALPFAS